MANTIRYSDGITRHAAGQADEEGDAVFELGFTPGFMVFTGDIAGSWVAGDTPPAGVALSGTTLTITVGSAETIRFAAFG